MLKRLAGLFRSGNKSASAAQNDVPPPATAKPDALTVFAESLRQTFSQNSQDLAGSLHVLGLDNVRARIGPKWPQIADQVNALACHVIDNHLTRADNYVRSGEFGYLMVFARLDKAAAQRKCAEIAEEICSHLFGAKELADVRIQSSAGFVDGELEFVDMTPGELLAAVDRQVVEGGNPVEHKPAPASPTRPAKTASEPEAPKPVPKKPEVDPEAAGTSERKIKEDQIGFRPIWDVKQGVISSFLCMPLNGTADDRPASELDIAHFDFKALTDVAECITELIINRFRFLTIVPVHHSTLSGPKLRENYARALEEIPESSRKYLVTEITGAPETLPVSAMKEPIEMLSALSSSLVLQTSVAVKDLSPVTALGFNGVSIDLSRDRRSERDVIYDLNDFAERADALGLTTYAHGIPSSSLAIATTAAGYRYIDGDIVKSVTDLPEHLYKYDLVQFYEAFLMAKKEKPAA